ncbi:MAG: hypothetical protein U0359_07990 [Byssovorax sp.]
MTAARPLPPSDDDLDVVPLDDACLELLSPEERALATAALDRIANGTVRAVPQAEIDRHLEGQRLKRAG